MRQHDQMGRSWRGAVKILSTVLTVGFGLAWRVKQGVGFWKPLPAACP
jgi:hypothetical protein